MMLVPFINILNIKDEYLIESYLPYQVKQMRSLSVKLKNVLNIEQNVLLCLYQRSTTMLKHYMEESLGFEFSKM